jgi:hypothetical protein
MSCDVVVDYCEYLHKVSWHAPNNMPFDRQTGGHMKGIVFANIASGPSYEELLRKSSGACRMSVFKITEHSFGEIFSGPDHTREISVEMVMFGKHHPVNNSSKVSFVARYRYTNGNLAEWGLYYVVGIYDTDTGHGKCSFIPKEIADRNWFVRSLFFVEIPGKAPEAPEPSEALHFTD